MAENYDDAYRTADWFGSRPDPLLERFADRLPAGSRVLDIGSGQGRHALPLARRGCRVTGLDTSTEAVDQVNAVAAAEDLDCTVRHEDVFAHEPDEPYDAVLCFGLVQMLPAERVSPLVEPLQRWVRKGGTLWLTAWNTDDPRCEKQPEPWRRTGPRAWHDSSGDRHRFYLHPDEILDLFPGWEVLHHHEGLGPLHRHGEGQEEQHVVVESVMGKPLHELVDVWTRLSG